MDIKTIAAYLKDLFATFMVLVMMIVPFGNKGVEYTAENSEDLITSFVAVSDIHVETNNPTPYQNLSDVLHGIKAGQDISTVVYTGDNVMNGQVLEDFFFYSAVRAVKPAEHNLVLTGNHDLGNSYGDYEKLREKFIFNNAFYLGNQIEADYYYRVIDGCYMIMLTSEDPTTWDFRMSEEQFAWLENVLKEADAVDAPVFVFNHYPLRYLKDNDPSRLANLLKEYNTELFIHGHIHDELGADNFYNSYGIDCINLPRCTEAVDYEAGDGIVVEVYEDEVVVRARNFVKGEWIEDFRYTY
ncbi:MAG: metallophosphoesterase [Clostridia bacterium]|nr:metallophosphoesterase [Clostridia bacterium]